VFRRLDHSRDLLQLVADISIRECHGDFGTVVERPADTDRFSMNLVRRVDQILTLFDIQLAFESPSRAFAIGVPL
jgi:hypothetical protein